MLHRVTHVKVKWKTNVFFWSVFHYFVPRCLHFPCTIGTLVPFNKSVYLEGSPSKSRFSNLTPHDKFCFTLYLSEWGRCVSDIPFFTLRWVMLPSFREKIELSCVFRILCAHFLRYKRVPYVTQVELAEFLSRKGASPKYYQFWIAGQVSRIRKVYASQGEDAVLELTYTGKF